MPSRLRALSWLKSIRDSSCLGHLVSMPSSRRNSTSVFLTGSNTRVIAIGDKALRIVACRAPKRSSWSPGNVQWRISRDFGRQRMSDRVDVGRWKYGRRRLDSFDVRDGEVSLILRLRGAWTFRRSIFIVFTGVLIMYLEIWAAVALKSKSLNSRSSGKGLASRNPWSNGTGRGPMMLRESIRILGNFLNRSLAWEYALLLSLVMLVPVDHWSLTVCTYNAILLFSRNERIKSSNDVEKLWSGLRIIKLIWRTRYGNVEQLKSWLTCVSARSAA